MLNSIIYDLNIDFKRLFQLIFSILHLFQTELLQNWFDFVTTQFEKDVISKILTEINA